MAISTVFDHFRAVKNWAAHHKARARLDMDTLQLEIRCANRYFVFYPQFTAMFDGRLAHVGTLSESVVGFGGWRPYTAYRTPLSQDKLLFKAHLRSVGLRVPIAWSEGQTPDRAYITKQSQGSFGYGIEGPFRADRLTIGQGLGAGGQEGSGDRKGTLYAEQFIEGRIVKLWLWGAKAIFADVQDYPCIQGDGIATVGELITQRLHGEGGSSFLAEEAVADACIAFQGLRREEILQAQRSVWIDFRYGRTFRPARSSKSVTTALLAIQAQQGDQLQALQHAVAQALREVVSVPVVCSVDGVLDEAGYLWWLELNSNPLLPHHGYDTMLCDLFDRDPLSP